MSFLPTCCHAMGHSHHLGAFYTSFSRSPARRSAIRNIILLGSGVSRTATRAGRAEPHNLSRRVRGPTRATRSHTRTNKKKHKNLIYTAAPSTRPVPTGFVSSCPPSRCPTLALPHPRTDSFASPRALDQQISVRRERLGLGWGETVSRAVVLRALTGRRRGGLLHSGNRSSAGR